jgi:hypothetical protein
LYYYASNPRIYSILKQHGDHITQQTIERHLWDLGSTKDLYHDIMKNGGLIEEILVRHNDKLNVDEVLEGNSRLCAYRHLLKNSEKRNDAAGVAKWSKIKAKVLPPTIDDEVVFSILGVLHIRGKAEWRPYEQASYLYRQSIEFKKSAQELAEQIGHSEIEIKNSIEAYKMMEETKQTDPNKFSYFFEFVKSRKFELLLPGKDLRALFVGLIEAERIPRADRVRDLPTILHDKKARKAFIDGTANFDDALEIARDRHPETTSSFYNKLKRATEALHNAEELRVKEAIDGDPQKKYILKNLYQTVSRFCKAVGLVSTQNNRNKRTRHA